MYPEPNEYVTRHDELLYSYNNKDAGTDSSGSYLIPGTIDPKKKNSNTKFIHTTRRPADNKADGIIGVSYDQPKKYTESNNDPLYPPNMIDILNTPFDHLDRIFL